jgi:hypothetical protein
VGSIFALTTRDSAYNLRYALPAERGLVGGVCIDTLGLLRRGGRVGKLGIAREIDVG